MEVGPKRDIVGELSTAVKNHNMKMGLYFMMYEAMNAIYQKYPREFIEKYSIPQFKDLYSTYKPSIVWPDGSWQHTAEEYHSAELLSWLIDSLSTDTELIFSLPTPLKSQTLFEQALLYEL